MKIQRNINHSTAKVVSKTSTNITATNILTNRTHYLVLGSVIGITLCTGAFLASNRALADDVVDPVSIEVPVACAMGGTGMTSHTATLNNGVYSGSQTDYTNGIGTTTLTTFCNDHNGFSIYAVGYTGNTTSGGNNNKLIGTNDSNLKINTGIYNSQTTTSATPSSWSMKITNITASATGPNLMTIQSDTEGSFSGWHTVPTAYTKIAQYKANTDTDSSATIAQSAGGTGAKLTATYDAYISTTQGADTYTGQVKYVMVHPYDASAPDDTLIMQNVAQWKNSLSIGQEVTAKDARDNKTYTVAKLADGNIWMTQNLDLAGGTALSADDTDIDSTYVANFITSNNLVKDNVNNTIVLPASGTFADDDTRLTDDTQFSIDDYSYVFNSHNRNGNWTENWWYVPSDSYYSWDAATLGSGRSIETDDPDAPYSICPKGWRLPTSGANYDDDWKRGDFYALATAYGFDLESSSETNDEYTTIIGPDTLPNFQFASYYSYGYWEYEGTAGNYWSSTLGSSGGALTFSIDSSMHVAEEWGTLNGFSVRCLAR